LEERLFALGQTNWLRYLYGRMNCSFNEFGENLVSFITFNYDRTIEHFLHTALCNTYKKHPELCAEQMSRIPIVHLHGRLGRLPWQGGSARPYEAAELNPNDLFIALNGIKIIHEDPTGDRDKDFQEAKRLLDEAERIYFLGFGFDATNVKRLGLDKLRGNRIDVRATAYGFTTSEIQEIAQRIENRITLHQDVDCISLMRTNVQW